MRKRIVGFMEQEVPYEEADIVIFGAGMDATTSYRPGTRMASTTMRQEFYGIETYSPYQKKDLTDCAIFDAGDLDIPFGNVEASLSLIEKMSYQILQDDKIPCMIGGEHLVSLGVMRSIIKKYPDVHVIHLDAHCDLRDDYLGEKLSHACVVRRISELMESQRIHQFGIRSGDKDEFQFGEKHCDFHPFHLHDMKEVCASLKDVPVYITLDLDVLDPSIFCGTGTPEPGGLTFQELLDGLLSLKDLSIVGFDVCELSPVYDASGVSTTCANKILRELLLIIGGKENE
ncbi:MAG: agmatinase [Longicatena sp.]